MRGTPKSSNCSASTGPRSESVVDEDHPHMRESMKDLIALYEAWNKPKSGEQNYHKQKLWKCDIEPPKWPNFDSQNLYNQNTTIQPLICPFLKNVHLISVLFITAYEKVNISQRIQ
jgi:hypothetical protein